MVEVYYFRSLEDKRSCKLNEIIAEAKDKGLSEVKAYMVTLDRSVDHKYYCKFGKKFVNPEDCHSAFCTDYKPIYKKSRCAYREISYAPAKEVISKVR